MDNNDIEEHDVNRRRYYRRSLGERTPLIELITVCYCIVAYVRRLTCDIRPPQAPYTRIVNQTSTRRKKNSEVDAHQHCGSR